MIKLIRIFFLVFTAFNIYAQDTIVLKNTDEIMAKVIEISPTEIRYKKFEDTISPDIVIKKSEVFMIKYKNYTREVFKDNDVNTTDQLIKKVKVIVYRPKNYVGALMGYNLIANGKKIARIKNGFYQEIEMDPGHVTFSAETETISKAFIQLEPDKIYYLKCTIDFGVIIGRAEINFVPRAIGETETIKLKK